MPYIIETRPHPAVAPDPEDPGYDMSVTRTAVATLDKAIDEVESIIEAHGYAIDEWPDVPENGTVGPLPDGTVIEVRPAPLNPFADANAWCDIYNRHHATR